jgi:hypothetical protein
MCPEVDLLGLRCPRRYPIDPPNGSHGACPATAAATASGAVGCGVTCVTPGWTNVSTGDCTDDCQSGRQALGSGPCAGLRRLQFRVRGRGRLPRRSGRRSGRGLPCAGRLRHGSGREGAAAPGRKCPVIGRCQCLVDRILRCCQVGRRHGGPGDRCTTLELLQVTTATPAMRQSAAGCEGPLCVQS